ncbi:MAG: hypothetical protein GY853_01910 [PVC group bacterium]|nr:hypothetical protein [PVC group bacterium]
MIPKIYKHNVRSYYDIYTPLTTAYPRKPTWVFKEMAGLFDFQSELMNIVATDILYPITRESSYSFAELCDYAPNEADGATDTLTITLASAMSKTLATGYQVGGVSISTGKTVIYELTVVGDSGGTNTITVACKQKRTYTDKSLGTITGSDDFADYPIDGYINIIQDSMLLTIGGDSWTKVDNFDDSESVDKHFVLIYQSSGKCRIGFGDDTTGAKPAINSTIYGTFEVTEGLAGRMDTGEITVNIGGDADISSITNTGSEGGSDAESIASIIRNARGNVRLRSMVWSQEDLETAAAQASANVVKALGLPNTPDVGQASIHIIPSGGGTVTGSLLSEVDVYVTALTQFGVMPITVSGTTYKEADVEVTYTLREDYDQTATDNLMEFALMLTTSAIDNQYTEKYDEEGIDACRTNVINVLKSWAFTEDENDALEEIIKTWQELLDAAGRDHREWGQPLAVGDLWVITKVLDDYGATDVDVVTPTSNITCSGTEIIDTGTITVTSA